MAENRKYYFLKLKEDFFEQPEIFMELHLLYRKE